MSRKLNDRANSLRLPQPSQSVSCLCIADSYHRDCVARKDKTEAKNASKILEVKCEMGLTGHSSPKYHLVFHHQVSGVVFIHLPHHSRQSKEVNEPPYD